MSDSHIYFSKFHLLHRVIWQINYLRRYQDLVISALAMLFFLTTIIFIKHTQLFCFKAFNCFVFV